MILVRLLLLPLRLLWFVWTRFRLLFGRRKDTLFHRVPDRFTMVRPSGIFAYFAARQETHFLEYLSLLYILGESKQLKRIILYIPNIEAGWHEICQIARSLQKLADQGKELIAFTEGGGIKTLYLASVATRRITTPHAGFLINLPAVDSYFVRDALKKAGVAVETYAAGRYNAGGYEIFTRTSYSADAKKNLTDTIGDLRAQIQERLTLTPGLSDTQRDALIKLLAKQVMLDASDLLEVGFFTEAAEAREVEPLVLLDERTELKARHIFAHEDEQAAAADLPTPESMKREARVRKGLPNEIAVYRRYRRARIAAERLRALP